MITIFSIPKPFTDSHISLIQNNAIKSWKAIASLGEINLFGNEPGIKATCKKYNLIHTANIKTNKFGTPLLNDVFNQAVALAKYDFLCYINADIILIQGIKKTLEKLSNLPQFLAIGQRIDLDIKEPIVYQDGWQSKLLARVKAEGVLHGLSGIDYFIFSKRLAIEMPDFAVGRPGWDNSFIYSIRKKGLPVVDTSQIITAVHQNHSYTHHKAGFKGIRQGQEAQENFRLAGGFGKMMTIRGANLTLTDKGLAKASLSRKIYSALLLFPLTSILIGFKRRIQNKLTS